MEYEELINPNREVSIEYMISNTILRLSNGFFDMNGYVLAKELNVGELSKEIIKLIISKGFYCLKCINEDGKEEINGYFLDLKEAEKQKEIIDSFTQNLKYGIKQNIEKLHFETNS